MTVTIQLEGGSSPKGWTPLAWVAHIDDRERRFPLYKFMQFGTISMQKPYALTWAMEWCDKYVGTRDWRETAKDVWEACV